MAQNDIPEDQAQQQPRPLQVPLPPAPAIPPVEKSPPPPSPIIGVLSAPDVLRLSIAAQAADREISSRRQRLDEDAKKEQAALRELGQALMRDRQKMKPEDIRAKEREYEDRVNESRRKFSERNRIIQEATQYVIMQIERTIELVTQQVATARGVNVVLSRAQVLGTTPEFDLTPQVADILNKVLTSVAIPPDGVSVAQYAASVAGPAPGGILAPLDPSAAAPLVLPPSTAPTKQ